MDVIPLALHHRLPVFIGSSEDIAELKSYEDVQQL
jgi:fructose-1,6-bisphosphatase